MRTKRTILPIIKHIAMLLSIPLVLSSTGYALFSQQLSISQKATKPTYTSSQKLLLSFEKTKETSGGSTTYHYFAAIKNNGTQSVTAWKSDFSLPSGYSGVSCVNSTCSPSGNVLSITNSSFNAFIDPGQTITYEFYFTSANPNYIFTTVAVSGTPALSYTTNNGLSASAAAGTVTTQDSRTVVPYTITVRNLTLGAIPGWRITTPYDTANHRVETIATTVNYAQLTSQLVFLSKTQIGALGTFNFAVTISSTDPNFRLGTLTIQAQN